MSVTCVFGMQWGDEGKGRLVDLLAADSDVVVRYQGGANAGHTVVVGTERYVLHLLPSGVLHPNTTNVIGNGVVVDPWTLLEEIDGLERRGTSVEGRLLLSDRAHVVLPYHRSSMSGPLQVAMDYGLPVVVTKVGGLVEAAEGYGGAVLVEPRDPESLRDGILRAEGLVGGDFSAPHDWNATRELYREVIASALSSTDGG